ncbi:MAG: alpha-L-fucosidase, partial [Planctomycetia bacterium]
GRLLDGYSMGGYGAARLGFKYPHLFRAVSIMGGGPLQAELIGGAPRAGERRAAEVLERVYGGDQGYFTSVSPRALAHEHADRIAQGSLIRMVCGDRDETFANNRDFHEHLTRLKIPHEWTVLPGVGHDPLRTLDALGDSNWSFYRKAFGETPAVRSDDPGTNGSPTNDATRFVPDCRIKPDDYTVLMVADGLNPGGLRAWIDDHRRMQVKNWPLGGHTTWDVEVVEAGDYAVNVLFHHGVKGALEVSVSAGTTRCAGVSEPLAHHEWRRFPLPGSLQLAPGRQRLTLGIAAVGGEPAATIEVLSVELVRPEVRERLRLAASTMRSQADTRWFRDAGYGLMCHWTSQTVPRQGPPEPYADAVRDFDVATFAEQVERTGAKFVTLTTSPAMLYFPAPLESLDRILPGRTTRRDLVGELAAALDRRGIRLMLYYHLGSNADPAWQKASGFWKTDTGEFWDNWTRVIGEAGNRYGDKLAGWWFDDGTANYYYRSAPWERLASAAKAGNPRRLVCFNPWVLPPATEFQDYLAGEGSGDPSLQGWLKPGDHGRISGGAHAGLQASAALIMEGDWLHTKRDTAIGPPRQSVAELVDLLRRFAALENVPMLNCEIYQDGTLTPATVELLHAAHQTLSTDAAPGGR